MGEMFSWWLLIEVLGVVSAPLATLLFARLPDRGWALTKPMGLLLLGWLVWFPLSVVTALPYSRGWIFATLLLFAAGNALLAQRHAPTRETLRALVQRQRAYLVTSEALFAAALALMGWIRSFTPAVLDTEKFMDVAFLSAIWRTPHLPPPDPWLSGEPINYYYFGHFLIATVAKLLGTQPAVAFNLGVALIFALAATAIFGVAANIVAVARLGDSSNAGDAGRALRRAAPFGIVSALLALVAGNLKGAQIWWQTATAIAQAHPKLLSSPWAWWTHRELWTQYDWWSPSRVIPIPSVPNAYAINEFPAFSFLLADLHAHLLALPFTALAVGVAFNLLLSRGEGVRAFAAEGTRSLGLTLLPLAASAALIGGLYAINGWDLPTYLGLTLLALAIQQWLAHGRQFDLIFLLDLAAAGVLFAALAVLLYLPFYRGFVSPSQGIAPVLPVDRTPPGYEFAIFGLPLFLAGSLLALWLARWVGEALATTLRHGRLAGYALAGALIALLLLVTLASAQTTGWTVFWGVLLPLGSAALVLRAVWPPALFAAEDFDALDTHADGVAVGTQRAPVASVSVARDEDDVPADDDLPDAGRARVWTLCLLGTATALVLACEFVFVRDIFGTRMNTVFKLYYQAWLLLAIVAGPALAWLLAAARRQFGALPALGELLRLSPGEARAGANGALAFAGAFPLPALARLWEGRLDGRAQAFAAVRGGATARKAEPETSDATMRDAVERNSLPGALRWAIRGCILIWIGALVTLGAAAFIYPTLATSARTQNFTLPRSLDGDAYMATDAPNAPAGCVVAGGSNAHDDEAIAWLNTHIEGSPTLVEAPGCEWSHYSRISAFTGLPTLIGWPGGHEGEWRANWLPQQGQGDLLGERANAVNAIYTNPDDATVRALLRRFDARLIYVGAAERGLYPTADLTRFSRFARVIYQRDGVTIYQVNSGV